MEETQTKQAEYFNNCVTHFSGKLVIMSNLSVKVCLLKTSKSLQSEYTAVAHLADGQGNKGKSRNFRVGSRRHTMSKEVGKIQNKKCINDENCIKCMSSATKNA